MNIAVYSGSFNPLHKGHLAILRYLVGEGGYDCVYLIVSPKNPLKEGISAASGTDRFNAAVEAVKRHFSEKIKVDDIELTMPAPHYTIRTLDALREREPGNAFTLVMGAKMSSMRMIHGLSQKVSRARSCRFCREKIMTVISSAARKSQN